MTTPETTSTGKDWLEARFRERGPAPMHQWLGIRLEEISEGFAKFVGQPSEDHYNPQGTVHGGYAATILDSAMGCAAHSLLPASLRYVTVELKLNYIRAMTAETGKIHCEGRVLHAGRRILTAERKMEDEAGKLIAHGTATFMVVGEMTENPG